MSCKGLVFKGYVTKFYRDNKLEIRKGLRLAKRKSCASCHKCLEDLQDLADSDAYKSYDFAEVEDKKYYSVNLFTNRGGVQSLEVVECECS